MMPVIIDSIVERSIHCSLAKAAIKYNPHACTYIRFIRGSMVKNRLKNVTRVGIWL